MNNPLLYKDVAKMPVRESGELLVVVNEAAPDVACSSINDDMSLFAEGKMILRIEVAEKLQRVQDALSKEMPGALIRLVYAYRHPSIQQRYFETMYNRIAERSPSATPEELREATHSLIASPDVAGHPTGGAVDVTISFQGVDIDMGTRIWSLDETDLIPVFSPLVSEEQRKNRMLLRTLMMNEEFAPFDGEWWHFSYGDKEWAAYYGKPFAVYEQIQCEKNLL